MAIRLINAFSVIMGNMSACRAAPICSANAPKPAPRVPSAISTSSSGSSFALNKRSRFRGDGKIGQIFDNRQIGGHDLCRLAVAPDVLQELAE